MTVEPSSCAVANRPANRSPPATRPATTPASSSGVTNTVVGGGVIYAPELCRSPLQEAGQLCRGVHTEHDEGEETEDHRSRHPWAHFTRRDAVGGRCQERLTGVPREPEEGQGDQDDQHGRKCGRTSGQATLDDEELASEYPERRHGRKGKDGEEEHRAA